MFRGDEGAAALPVRQALRFSANYSAEMREGRSSRIKFSGSPTPNVPSRISTAAVPFTFPFDGLNATLAEPYREFDTDERVDWNMRGSTRAFYRFNFFQNTDLRPYGSASSTQQFRNDNNTLTNALGVDFNTGLVCAQPAL